MLRTASSNRVLSPGGSNLGAAQGGSADVKRVDFAAWLSNVRTKWSKQILLVCAFWVVLVLVQYAQYEALSMPMGGDGAGQSQLVAEFDRDGFAKANDLEAASIDPEDDTPDYSDVFAAALSANSEGGGSSPWDDFHKLILTKPLMFRSRLPRSTSRPYNYLPKELKGFSYSPSGGYNNQLRCLIAAIVLCKQANRALLVPMAGPHTNFARNYLKNTLNSLVPMDQLVDFDYLEKQTGVPLIPLNMTLHDYRRKRVGNLRVGGRTPKAWIFQIGTPLSWIVDRGVREHEQRIRNYQGRILIYIGPFYTRHWQEDWVINSIRYTAYLRGLSKHIANEALDGGHFNAVHLRLGDYRKLALTKSKDARAYVRRGKEAGFSKGSAVYVATDQPSRRLDGSLNTYFSPFGYFDKLLFARDLANHPRTASALLDFENRLPNNPKVASDMFGLVEQLICARSQIFVGTSVSTFSKTIAAQRGNLINTIPEIDPSIVANGLNLLIRWSGYIDVESKVRLRADDPRDEEEDARNKARQEDEAAALAAENALDDDDDDDEFSNGAASTDADSVKNDGSEMPQADVQEEVNAQEEPTEAEQQQEGQDGTDGDEDDKLSASLRAYGERDN